MVDFFTTDNALKPRNVSHTRISIILKLPISIIANIENFT